MSIITTFALPKFRDAAASAASFEVLARLLADNTEAIRHTAHAHRLSETVEAVCTHFTQTLSEDDAGALKRATRLRNKVLHFELWTAADILAEAGASVDSGQVVMGNLHSLDVALVAESKAEGRIFGWLLEGARSGLFEEAEHLFDCAITTIQRLINEQAYSGPHRPMPES